jgi:hypothetical protein
MQRVILLLLALAFIPLVSHAQKWKRQRKEYSFGIGVTNFLGDLGGRNQVGSNFVQDLDVKATRYAIGLGYRYQIERDFYLKGDLNYVQVSGSDALTLEPSRSARNLNFKSNMIELVGVVEYKFIRQKSGHIYKLKGVKGKRWFKFEVYALVGIGALWYSSKGQKDGKWYGLAALNTEGQGLPNGIKDYSQFTAVIPYGIGFRRSLGGGARSRSFGSWSISLELTMRKTFSDYIDDVSNTYYDSEGVGFNNAPDASAEMLYFADPSDTYNNGGYSEPQQRGNVRDKDAYMLGIIAVNYKPARRRKRYLPKF